MLKQKPKELTPEQKEEIRTKDFFDMILPGTVKFFSDHYVVGDSYRSVWAVREYPPTTEEQAILSQLGDRSGVTLRIYHRLVESMEQRKIIQNATRRNKLKSGGNDVNETIEAEGNLQDVVELLANLRKNKEPLLHCSVFIELKAKNMDALKELQSEIAMELTRSKISVDRLTLRQKEGFLSVLPVGANQFGAQYERVLPASSVANLYPFNFSGKTDPQGVYIGRDKFGTNILVDFDRRAEDKTTSNILILGNSGQGKSYLLKLILTNIRESGKSIICLDPESEYEELCSALGGCYIDFLSGEYTINPLEPKSFGAGSDDGDNTDCPDAFKKVTRLSQHIAFLKDFFRSYKDFSDTQIDTIEILLSKLYARFGITDSTDYSKMKPIDYPIMEDFYKLCEEEFMTYDKQRKYLYTEETLAKATAGLSEENDEYEVDIEKYNKLGEPVINAALLDDMLMDSGMVEDSILHEGYIELKLNRQIPDTPYRKCYDANYSTEIEIICAKHALWIYDVTGGERADFSDCLLENVDLSNCNLCGADFSGATLINCNLDDASMCDADFKNAKFSNCSFKHHTAENADFKCVVFEKCNCTGAYFGASNFTNAQLNSVSVMNADFGHCCMQSIQTKGTNLAQANTQGVMYDEQEYKEKLLQRNYYRSWI